ncbi:PEP-CTERM sorting domain-containing protein [Massilia sp. IC2-476]|uniref:PEP-CTERM sorting domain-containing protein n=1 Tax=Massilia sp. IC2-476 TaxID=2887199 RepID=UPI001D128E24|nr:PEP-CTERM sorting domain-containing protein [Massilia sp. IC2-476]MCC2974831.1 PEP-CTERM sorting domain-containing protein [Massilia sp. IC2-476]
MKSLLRSAVVLALLGAGAAQAATVTVTSVSNAPAPNTWYLNNFRGTTNGYTSNTFASITSANPRSGNGSVEMSSTDGSGKADYVYTWGFVPGRTLGSIDTVGMDWFRAPGTSAAHLAPALRLYYDADGDATTLADQGYLIWEQVYNGVTAQNQWVSSDMEDEFFWQRQLVPGNTVEDYDMTLGDWASGVTPNVPNGAPFDRLSASTAILGIEFGIGSGWAGTFRGFVDNVRIGFAGEEATTFNFETAGAQVPEPASLALLGLGALGFAARRRKQK